jgi:pimeloyl-ACP methyl ester carboxylesterase
MPAEIRTKLTQSIITLAVAGALVLALAPDLAKAAAPQRAIHETGFVRVDGADVYYEVRASRSAMRRAIPVVLVHGLSLDNRMWDRQFDVLSNFFVTYRFDMRGHGRSHPVTGPVGLHDDLVGVMDALGIERAHLVGQSLGGNAVTEVAATHPERVGRVVLIDSGINGFQYPTPNVLQRIPTYLDIDRTQGRDVALAAWLRDPLFSTSYQDPTVRPALERIISECPCSLFFNPQFQVRPPTFSRLAQVTAPTRVLIGALDEHEFQAAAEALDAGIPLSEKIVIPGAGHMANMDRPLRVTAEILRFLLGGGRSDVPVG